MAEFQARNPPGLNESTNGIIPHLNASSVPVSGVASVPIRVPAGSVAADTVTRPKWIDIYDEIFGSTEEMDESVDYRGKSNKKKSSKPNAAKSGSSTRPNMLLSNQSGEKPGALHGKNKNNKTKSSSASVPTKVILQHKIFLKRNKRLVLKRKSRPIVKHKACAQTISSNGWASSENDTVASSIVAIKEENKASKKRKHEEITQAKKNIKSKTDPLPSPQKKDISSILSYTEKQRIQNILQTFITQNVHQIDYYEFRRTYRNKYGERLNVDNAIVREFISTIPPWQVRERRKNKSGGRDRMCYDLENQNMTDTNQLSKGDKQKSNNGPSSLPHTKISTSGRYEQRAFISTAFIPTPIPSKDWASSEDDVVGSSSITIKDENKVSRTRKCEDVSQAKTETDPSSSTLSSTEKQRIRNILQTLAADKVFRLDYYEFRKTYQQKYGEMLNVEGTIVREFMNTIPPWQVTRGNGVGRIHHYFLVNQNMTVTHEKFKGDNHISNNNTSSSPRTKISTIRSSTAAAHENTSASVPNDSCINTLLEKQRDLSKKILEAQLKKNKLDEKDVLLFDQLLEAQLINNELHEECNLILLLNSKNEGGGKRNGE